MKNAGENFELTTENLRKELSCGKFKTDKIIYVGPELDDERFAIIALTWDGKPRLAIRWFYNKLGFPYNNEDGNGNASWFIVPPSMNEAIISDIEKKIASYHLKEIKSFLGI